MIKRCVVLLSLILFLVFAKALAADAGRHVPTIDELLTIKSVGGAQIAPDGQCLTEAYIERILRHHRLKPLAQSLLVYA